MLQCFVAAFMQQSAIPIIPIVTNEFEQWLAAQDSLIKTWVRATAFNAQADTFCLVPNEQGQLVMVLAGVNQLTDFWALAGLAKQLPVGDYVIPSITDKTLQQKIALAWGLGAYQFNRYKTSAAKPVARLGIDDDEPLEIMLQALYQVRDLINTPTEHMGPADLALAAEKLAEQFNAKCLVIVGEELLTANYPTIHAVGRASTNAPRLIDLQWGNSNDPKLTLVGKGVCFDTGGLDLKPADGMLLMRKDMGGAAHALGLAHMIMGNNLPVRLRVLIPAVENAVAGNAFRPGDIITTRKGLTVEITNTDAEGRLILADALVEAASENPQLLIDFATLTGAARVALGVDLPALFTLDDQLAEQILNCAKQEQDFCWRLPMHTPYRTLLDTPYADIKNVANGSFAGAITAALFLKEFVPAAISWAHFDLMAWNVTARPGRPEGGEAMMLRTMFSVIKQRFEI